MGVGARVVVGVGAGGGRGRDWPASRRGRGRFRVAVNVESRRSSSWGPRGLFSRAGGALGGVRRRGGSRSAQGQSAGRCRVVAAGVAGELPGDVQDPVAQPFGLVRSGARRRGEQLRPDDDVVRAQRELEPRGVRLEGVEGQVAGAGRLERLDAILDVRRAGGGGPRARRCPGSVWSVMKHWKRCPSRSVKDSCAPGCGRSRRQISRVPSGQSGRLTWPVSSVTHAPSRGSPSWSIAGRHADSGRPAAPGGRAR